MEAIDERDLPDDWNPNKEPRATLIHNGYDIIETVRAGQSMYETWRIMATWGPVYHIVHYRWSQTEGWVAVLQANLLDTDREDLL